MQQRRQRINIMHLQKISCTNNGKKTVVTSLVTLCPYHVLTLCVRHPCTHALPHGMYLLTKQEKDLDRDSCHIDRKKKRTIDPMEGKPNVTTDIPLTGRENADGSAGKNSVSSGMEG